MKNHSKSLLLLVALLFIACQAELPKGILSERRMERVLYDFHKAQSMADIGVIEGRSDEIQRYELQEAVFQKHHITREVFDSSMNYYCSNLERLNHIYMRLNRRLKREAEALGEVEQSGNVYTSLSAEGDTANVWGGAAIMVVTNVPGDNVVYWRQPCDSTWQSDDDVMWHFEHKYLSRESSPTLYADIVVRYTNDSTRAMQARIHNDRGVDLRVQTPKGWTPQSISGHLFMPVENDANRRSMFVVNGHLLVRFRKHIQDEHQADSLQTDSTRNSQVGIDSLMNDSLQKDDMSGSRRLSPEEFRNKQPVDQKIDIIKEKPYKPSARPSRSHLQPMLRQKK